jgi:hypothetical protein
MNEITAIYGIGPTEIFIIISIIIGLIMSLMIGLLALKIIIKWLKK